MSPAAVIVILNGAIVASVPPAQLLFGHVMAPLAPVITRFTARAALDGDTITLTRGTRTCVFRVGSEAYNCDGVAGTLPVAPLAATRYRVRAVGRSRARLRRGDRVRSARRNCGARRAAGDGTEDAGPVRSGAPSATPTTIFTPSPAPAPPATAAPPGAATPLPRRTAIPAIPSRVPGD